MSNVFAYFHRGRRVIKMVYLQYICPENGRFVWFVTFVKEWLRACVIPKTSQKRKLTNFSEPFLVIDGQTLILLTVYIRKEDYFFKQNTITLVVIVYLWTIISTKAVF